MLVTTLGTVVTAIGAGSEDTCTLTSQGGVKCWGGNEDGETGWNTNYFTYSFSALDVQGLSQSTVTSISIGYHSSCATTTTGAVLCSGSRPANRATLAVSPVAGFAGRDRCDLGRRLP